MSDAAPQSDAITARRLRNVEGHHQPQAVQVWLIIGCNGQYTLHLLNLTDNQTVVTLMHILRKEYNTSKPAFLWYHTRAQIEEAELSPLCIGDLEAQDYPRPVLLQSTTPRPDLTDAFHNPTLARASAFLRFNPQFNIATRVGQDAGPLRAILIKTEISKWVILLVVGLGVLFAVGMGVLVGLWAGSLVAGLGTCAGVVGVLAFIQAFCFGMKLLG